MSGVEDMAKLLCEIQHGPGGWDLKDRNQWRDRAVRVLRQAAHARSVFAADREQYTGWPCDDYEAPLTCYTVPSGRKQPICDGCRAAFPRGAQVQRIYRASAYRWTRTDGAVIFIDPSEIACIVTSGLDQG